MSNLCSKSCDVLDEVFGFLSLGIKGSNDFTVSISVGKHVFSKMAHRILLKLLMKLRCFKAKKLTESDFLEKISFWG